MFVLQVFVGQPGRGGFPAQRPGVMSDPELGQQPIYPDTAAFMDIVTGEETKEDVVYGGS